MPHPDDMTPDEFANEAHLIGIRPAKEGCKGAWIDRVRWALIVKARLIESDDVRQLFAAVDDANTCAVRA